jgi:hypothetical protein
LQVWQKSFTGTDHDADWNDLAGQVVVSIFTGRVAGSVKTISGQLLTQEQPRIGGTGGTQTTLATTTGFYSLTTHQLHNHIPAQQ